MKIKYYSPSKGTSSAQNTSIKRRLVTIHPPVRLVGEPKKKKEGRKKKRHLKQWQTVKCHPNRLKGYGTVGSKMAIPHYFGQWLIQQLLLPFKLLYTSLIKSLYEMEKSNVRVTGGKSDWFNVLKGVRQGCLLSPYLSTSWPKFSCVWPLQALKADSRLEDDW